MPLYALPLTLSTSTNHSQSTSSRVRFSHPARKRKRAQATSDDDPSSSEPEADFAAASTNPLSLAPAEIAQYKLAGLRLDEELPAIKSFPHRGLPDGPESTRKVKGEKKGSRKGKERALSEAEDGEDGSKPESDVESSKTEVKDRKVRGAGLRLQHLAVLTTILQRCLQEGDIPRATRAWSMLLRVQVFGQGMDYRGSGYWGIGAELLARSLEKKRRKYSYDSDSDDPSSEDDTGKRLEGFQNGGGERNHAKQTWKWCSKTGLEKAKEYYERLILQHPYKRQFHTSVSALDFWPAMIGCEIYGIDTERQTNLQSLELEEEKDEGGERSGSQSEASDEENAIDLGGVVDDAGFVQDQKRRAGRMKRRAGRRWMERDEVRRTALVASEKVAARLDDLMVAPPYSDSHHLLRLRGMLALYIGALSVPAKPDANEEIVEGERSANERRLRRQRLAAHEKGKERRKSEVETARKFFDRIEREGGDVSDVKLPDLDEGDNEELELGKE